MKENLLNLQVKGFQADFLYSQARFPALIAGIGTGKTYMMLLKIWQFCEKYPDSLALVTRRTYTDLRDSTIKDFCRYFNVSLNADKEYHMSNGSVIMFRHGDELNVLKNINLSIAGIEQAEEFPTDEQFTFIRDRLRRTNAPVQQLCVIANAMGHNWIWKKWINNPVSKEYDAVTANTFENADNLPEGFLNDLRQMEIDAPNHYKQYVMNSFEEVDADDLLFTHEVILQAQNLNYIGVEGTKRRILAVDVARYGDDETVFTVLESKDIIRWEQVNQESWRGRSLMEVVGKVLDMHKTFHVDITVIDDVGMGGGVTDRLAETRIKVSPFNGGEGCEGIQFYNKKAEAYFRLKDMMDRGYLKILKDDVLVDQLLTIRYRYRSDKAKMIIGKEEMRKDGITSPDRADALSMAAFYTGRALALPKGRVQIQEVADNKYDPMRY